MSNEESILNTLSTLKNRGICDDCLEAIANVHPRQQVYQIVSRLAKEGRITRRRGDCQVRHVGVIHGPKEKLLNYLRANAPEEHRKREKPPTLALQTNEMSQWLFEAEQFLNLLENLPSSKEFFAARLARLKSEGKLTKALAAQMQLLNTYRVQIVKERVPLDSEGWGIAVQTMEKTRSDWKKLLLLH